MDREQIEEKALNTAYEVLVQNIVGYDTPSLDDFVAAVMSYRSALEAAGVVMVPREPTYEMASEGDSMMPQFSAEYAGLTGHDVAVEVYAAMLAARPK